MHTDGASWAQRSLLPVPLPPSLLLVTTPLLEPPLELELELDVPPLFPVPATRPEQAMTTTPPTASRNARISPRNFKPHKNLPDELLNRSTARLTQRILPPRGKRAAP
jgi:hypothetical protein